jgi:hypothetical protein
MRALWSSDHHTLHNNTPTRHILGNLDTFLLKDHDLAKVDIVFFGGDFFEGMVERPNPDMYRVEEWATRTFREFDKHNVITVFLAGTQSHDMGQPAHFKFNAPPSLDFRYIDTLCIETYDKLDGLTVMYVPDNMGALTPDDIWEKALKVLAAANLTQVDLIAFHGAFEFQLHPKARHKAHNLERWESIAKYAIFAGHIHKPVQTGKLYTSGSFDRDKHGEEYPKGGYCIDLDLKTGKFNPVFWENKNALPYLTMNVTQDITPEQLVSDVHAFIRDHRLPKGAHVRIMGGAAEIVNPVVTVLGYEYPDLHIKAENELSKEILLDEELFDSTVYEGVTIGCENIASSLKAEMTKSLEELERAGISEDEAFNVLKEFL